MNGPPPLTPAHYASRGRQPRSTSDASPTRQRNTDDLLSNLTPRTVVDAFRNPSGAMKACIDSATPAEQAFALRVAVASNNIHEWLEELSAWPWPANGGSAGFEMATARRSRTPRSDSELSDDEPSEAESYMGAIARYDRRIEEIGQGLDELDIEEIKTQVLRNHIMPLSRPGTPAMDSAHARASAIAATARMDDLTALITTTTLQALPNLSKLSKLMNSWNFRIQVLRMVPAFLDHVADAEVALQSGQNVIGLGAKVGQHQPSNATLSTLSRAEFEVMKPILERKVAKAGQHLDAMLDILEGQPDTLPEKWIDRVDALEQAYGEWSVACERKIRETDLARMIREIGASAADPGQPAHDGTNGNAVASKQPIANGPSTSESGEPGLDSPTLNGSSVSQDSKAQTPVSKPVIKLHLPPAEATEYGDHGTVLDLTSPTVERQARRLHGDYAGSGKDELSQGMLDGSHHNQVVSLEGHAEAVHDQRDERLAGARLYQPDSDSDLSDNSYVYQAGLPPLPRGRRDSGISESSTIVHEPQDSFTDSFCSDQFDQGTPERLRQRYMDPDATMNDDLVTSDSPTPFRSSTRSMSVSFSDKPIITELPSFENPPSTPTKSPSIPEDDILAEEQDSPIQISTPHRDDQLRQQISEILESVPAKIRLKSEPPAFNLNPPDFKMPLARKSSRPSDAIQRTQSNMSMRSAYSSRSGTPSFILAPAYARNSRPRQQRGNQEIKVYHLSRSNGEAPIKLFIRCVGEHGERVMVRVGGGWADLGEYLKEYASHHGRRSGAAGGVDGGRVEVKDLPRTGMGMGTPPSRPTSAMDSSSPVGGSGGGSISPLKLRKTRRPTTASDNDDAAAMRRPKTPSATIVPKPSLRQLNNNNNSTTTPSPPGGSSSIRSRASSRISWDEEDSFSLGMAGPRAKQIEMSEESRAWVESVKEKVRLASGEYLLGRTPSGPVSSSSAQQAQRAISQEELVLEGGGTAPRFGEIGKVGGTKRVFRRGP
ncbi:GAR domain-containing protein [Madurella fahalii]|uniref:GAR domain-containing protein n=1 Tax=Madurella fahalii TaxID=1157608 RepID=A0ABQ0G8X9_9PEZI